ATIAMRTRKPIHSPHFLSGGRAGLTGTAGATGAAMTVPPKLNVREGCRVPRGLAMIYLKREYRRRNRFGARLSFAFPLPNRGTKQPRGRRSEGDALAVETYLGGMAQMMPRRDGPDDGAHPRFHGGPTRGRGSRRRRNSLSAPGSRCPEPRARQSATLR